MSVTVRIPTPLRKVTNGADKAEVEAGALSAIMSSLNNQFPGNRERLWLYLIGSLVSSGVCGLMTYRTGMTTWEQLSKQQVLIYGIEVPQYLVTWIIPYGFGLLTIQFFRMGVNAFRRKSYTETVEELGV